MPFIILSDFLIRLVEPTFVRLWLFFPLRGSVLFLTFLFSGAVSFSAWSLPEGKSLPLSHELPAQLEGVGIDEKLGEKIDLNLEFIHDEGHSISLSKIFDQKKPVLMTMVYYDCPSLCNLHLNGLTDAIKKMGWKTGEQYQLVAVSMDHKEGYELAQAKKKSYLKLMMGSADLGSGSGTGNANHQKAMSHVATSDGAEAESKIAADGWHFLTGSEANVKALADQLGFKFKWNDKKKEFSHASAAFILTPQGEISRYLHGVEFVPQTVKFSLIEAGQGRVGTIIEQIVLYCFQFDPSKNKYTIYAFNIMRIAGVLMILLMAVFLIPNWMRKDGVKS